MTYNVTQYYQSPLLELEETFWLEPEVEVWPEARPAGTFRIDGITLVAVALLVAVGASILLSSRSQTPARPAPQAQPAAPAPARPITPEQPVRPAAPALPAAPDPRAFAAPYDDYVLTQGLHGYSYGHAAIDITAGNGATIQSPINGVVSALFADEIGNPVLVLENDAYQVTLMHGNYSVAVGDNVTLGQPVGTESNQGNTKDWLGHTCRNRDCGYHTHLNVYDKQLGANVNPLELIGK
ncbi:MAG: peptidoglycan DD-metalloendopeptidase family protein [Chloroflexi bacterium]|nr:peptidoglycan DD-metalloendopeptidase family protein [Chloroflexota bacterium]MCI0648917.1 peptidoglycan DD-metalloendopeptidase family protein [Chloroflexota bacterium]MCI0731107.1 peptidoglycan DD-metalloendopeptidase family protein [Chloroflexota bacterium]